MYQQVVPTEIYVKKQQTYLQLTNNHNYVHFCLYSRYTRAFYGALQGYKDTYSPMTFKCTFKGLNCCLAETCVGINTNIY